MAVRTKQLASGRLSTVGTTEVYQVPAGETAIVKSWSFFNVNATTNQGLTVLVDAGAFNNTSYHFANLPASSRLFLGDWLVLPPGASVALNLSTAIGLNFWISGTELEGVAD